MAGAYLDTGITGSVVGSLYGGNGFGQAAAPPRTAIPEGPLTVAQAAYGRGNGGRAGNPGMVGTAVGIAAVVLLVCMWAALPR